MGWKKTVNVHAILHAYGFHEEEHEEEGRVIAGCAAAILALLEQELPSYAADYGHNLEDIADAGEYAEWAELEYEINELYDFADRFRYWMGAFCEDEGA